ncbi:Succinate dehydrogenase/Fumarate reductase transmembrane subunit [Metallosphaera yellowstonensis MK1]|jgi:succinate dehydrogenase hydrophobic anchor subunit|uniref:Succinate dehydrogenase/Fumarate reductase transmembrane subunit n=1 Tax=Metallosphaera yellowstonensis MK1 TaxID=671065 RepID=H2C0M7_9CREN|nr:succinate dehydrogenase/Fumarate reductase subunit [Metallosphaera yellowstonensis]EHP71289.1 Succinate dehydrogenase/Fumarate reductase transmembrane subunit [Metallosphaera yellowstonensis MK1]
MRESTLRELTYLSGLAILLLVIIHLVKLSVGGFTVNTSFSQVALSLKDPAYSVTLILLLAFILTHSSLGIRRTLLDSGKSNLTVKAALGILGVVFLIILVLGILTVW